MVQLVTPEALASYMQETNLDRSSAEQAIEIGSAFVESKTGMAFSARTATIRPPSSASNLIHLSLRPIRSVSSVSIDGTPYGDYSLTADGAIYRALSWRTTYTPQTVTATIEYGLIVTPADIKGVVFEVAAGIYDGRVGIENETIDDYRVAYSGVLSQVSMQTLGNYGADVGTLSMTGR